LLDLRARQAVVHDPCRSFLGDRAVAEEVDGHTAAVRTWREGACPGARQRLIHIPFHPAQVRRHGTGVEIRSTYDLAGVRIEHSIDRRGKAVVESVVTDAVVDLGLAIYVRGLVANPIGQVAADTEHGAERVALDVLAANPEIEMIARHVDLRDAGF